MSAGTTGLFYFPSDGRGFVDRRFFNCFQYKDVDSKLTLAHKIYIARVFKSHGDVLSILLFILGLLLTPRRNRILAIRDPIAPAVDSALKMVTGVNHGICTEPPAVQLIWDASHRQYVSASQLLSNILNVHPGI